jgi:hypothetical protein
MPVTKSRNGINEMQSLDQTNITAFLFNDEEEQKPQYLQLQAGTTAENFPILEKTLYKVRSKVFPPEANKLTAIRSYPRLVQRWTLPRHRHRDLTQVAGPHLMLGTALRSKAFRPIAFIR